MQLKLFIVPLKNVAAAEAEMNAFLPGHRVLAVKKEFVPDGENSFWTFCVEHLEGTTPPASPVRGDMFIAPTPNTCPSPVRGDMSIAPTPATYPSPVRGGMFIAQAKDGFSRSGVSSGAMPPLPGWTTVLPWFYKHAAPTGEWRSVKGVPFGALNTAALVAAPPLFVLVSRLGQPGVFAFLFNRSGLLPSWPLRDQVRRQGA